jgi:hypothetical protein
MNLEEIVQQLELLKANAEKDQSASLSHTAPRMFYSGVIKGYDNAIELIRYAVMEDYYKQLRQNPETPLPWLDVEAPHSKTNRQA